MGVDRTPSADCAFCPRLVAFRHLNRKRYPAYHNNPVAAFGSLDARLLLVGLAPGLHGANQTGRPFTGDYAGDLLYPTLTAHGFATGSYGRNAGDGLLLIDCRISNAVRCVPPENKPIAEEIQNCRPFLEREIAAMPHLEVILALGRIAHDNVLRALGCRLAEYSFAHAAVHTIEKRMVIDSYHCSRYNTNTGRLTAAMFADVVARCRTFLEKGIGRL